MVVRSDKSKISDTDAWATPQDIFDALDEIFGFTVDLAASKSNTKVPDNYYDKARDGLKADLTGEVVWCNPPYSKPEPWVRKFCDEASAGTLLLGSDTSTDWFHYGVKHSDLSFLVHRRIRFIHPDTGKPEGSGGRGAVFFVKYGLGQPAGHIDAGEFPRLIEVIRGSLADRRKQSA